MIELLEDTFAYSWLFCRHLAMMISCFSFGASSRTDFFGSYHTDLVVSLFPRLIDLHNFEVVLLQLSARDCAAVYLRLGWLNIFNPMKPEGYWELDLCRYEERMVAKMLIALALVEPGDNWQEKAFRWSRRGKVAEVEDFV